MLTILNIAWSLHIFLKLKNNQVFYINKFWLDLDWNLDSEQSLNLSSWNSTLKQMWATEFICNCPFAFCNGYRKTLTSLTVVCKYPRPSELCTCCTESWDVQGPLSLYWSYTCSEQGCHLHCGGVQRGVQEPHRVCACIVWAHLPESGLMWPSPSLVWPFLLIPGCCVFCVWFVFPVTLDHLIIIHLSSILVMWY